MKAMYLHITKTGGTSLRKMFGDQVVKIRRVEGIQTKHLPNTFTMVRNPYARLVSLYYHLLEKEKRAIEKDSNYKPHVVTSYNFKELCLSLGKLAILPPGLPYQNYVTKYGQHPKGEKGVFPAGFGPMIKYTHHENIQVRPENVFKLEDFDRAAKTISKRFNLKYNKLLHINKSSHKDYRLCFDKDAQDAVYKFYEEDFKRFGYRYDL
jgi:hypothetical protein